MLFIIAVLFVHANEQAPNLAEAHLVELSNNICSVQDPEHGSLCKCSRA